MVPINIPVIIYHEGNQKYLAVCIEQAKKYNKRVILLGNSENQSFNVEWYNADNYLDDAWNAFKGTYVHMSSHTEQFELTCIKRFYVIRNFLITMGIDRCVYLDSDIMTYADFSQLDDFQIFDAGLSIPHEQEPYFWVANAGISFWTVHALNEMLSFFEAMYTEKLSLLQEKWQYHIEHAIPGGICDMTLEYLWSQNTSLRVSNLCVPQPRRGQETVFDYNGMTSENYYRNEYKMDTLLGIKKIEFHDGRPVFTSADDTYKVNALAVHFLGVSKMYMADYFRYEKTTSKTKLLAFGKVYIGKILYPMYRKVKAIFKGYGV